jgi:predicted DCC family thiol-disulfide oxidoreductase YuxK
VPERPLLLFDGDCGFCRYCIEYLEALTGHRLECAPFQSRISDYPALTAEQCQASIQLINPGGNTRSGAAAALQALADCADRPSGWRLYNWLPGFALLAEWVYRLVSRHRNLTYRACRTLFGKQLLPLRYERTSELFLRALGVIYLFAFSSYALQVAGLYGSEGIIPLVDYLSAVELDNWQRLTVLPTVFWLSQADAFLLGVPLLAMAFCLLMMAGIARGYCLAVLWLCYLSLVNAGPVFMQFQWDTLLLECGFIAIVLNGMPTLGCWLYRWLLFRFMWMSGWVKILSEDPLWANGTALNFHFETQPLPTVIAWYAHQLPDVFLQLATRLTLGVELLVPLLIFTPRQPRLLAFWAFVVLETLILLTGNYNFFNLLTLALCLFLLDDNRLSREMRSPSPAPVAPGIQYARRLTGALLVGGLLITSVTQLYLGLAQQRPSDWQRNLLKHTQAFHLVNSYGVFAVMTPRRPELIIEGSNDSLQWHPYRFHFKPDALGRAPTWVAPWQPRLDWQLWFAALGTKPPQWLENLLVQLLMGSSSVNALFAETPYGDEPPAYIRVVRYRYRFTDGNGAQDEWWQREYMDVYQAPMRLSISSSLEDGEEPEIPW